ncbi:MAG TPA: glycoside hydrolase family 15 protein [Mycobacteriales bacterium]|nr:glycoside hydrolase family 15 protein [Mycobacteriales bacterium]
MSPAAPRAPEPGLLIEDYAIVGDTHTIALVGRNGSIDWLCLPRFDSAACFAGLLGTEDNGRWQICPRGLAEGRVRRTTRRYRADTLILETEWETDTGVVRLIDAMPPRDGHADIVRRVECLEGEVEMAMRLVIRFGYGGSTPWVRRTSDVEGCPAILAIAGPDAVVLRGDVLPEADRRSKDKAHHAYFTVRAGERVDTSMVWFASHEQIPHHHDVGEEIARTEEFWREWAARTRYDGPYADAVQRSLITLKAMTYAPTGGIVAAPTTSLPEQIGGVRNWDYRFCWLRDAALVLEALGSAGHTEEAESWRSWLLRAVAGSPAELQIMYGLAGERQLPELELAWLPGYEQSQPVRVGNGASTQFQLDVYGEIGAALYLARAHGLGGGEELAWPLQRAILGHLELVLDRPDSGLWEVRGPPRRFTHSQVLVWVAFDRAVRAAEEFGLEGPVDRWRELRDRVHAEVCEQAWDAEAGTFTQYFGGRELDAAVLVMSAVGFLPGDDPRMLSTIDAISAGLRDGPLVARYRTEEGTDGLPPGEGAFLACSFWLVTALALAGRRPEAVELFEQLLALRNDVGLLAEEYDGGLGRMTGNFPQAFSHLTLVEAAMVLARTGDSGGPPAGRTAQTSPQESEWQ